MKLSLRFALIFIVLLTACSPRQIMVDVASPLFPDFMTALYEEPDLQLARTAIEADIKLLDGLLRAHPDHEENRLLMAQALTGYALVFVARENPQRAERLYQRSRAAAATILNFAIDPFLMKRDAFDQWLDAEIKDDWEALFWFAFATGAAIQLDMSNPGNISRLPRVETVMGRIVEKHPDYFFGAGLLFLGAVSGSKPTMLGGDPGYARQCFQRVREFNGGEFLLADVYEALYLAAPQGDEELYDQLLERVLALQLIHPAPHALLDAYAQTLAHDAQNSKELWF